MISLYCFFILVLETILISQLTYLVVSSYFTTFNKLFRKGKSFVTWYIKLK